MATVYKMAKGNFSRYFTTYNVGFINDIGAEDETQFDDVKSVKELSELFREFCKENDIPSNTVLYVEAV